MSKLCRAACRIVVEVVMAKLDNYKCCCRRTNPILRFRTNRIHPDDEAKSELDRPSWAVFSYVSPLASSIIGLGMMSPI